MRVKTWIDKEVAHYDTSTGEFIEDLSSDDVHGAVDLVFDTYERYCALLLGTQALRFAALQPWESTFRYPWIPDDAALQRVRSAGVEKQNRRLGVTPRIP